MTKLPSYQPCPCSGSECHLGTETEPCWGTVTLWSDFFEEERLYTCEGHSFSMSHVYEKSTYPQDQEKMNG